MAPVTVGWITPGQVEVGLWCDRCLLPSAVRVQVAMVSDSGVQALGAAEACHECGHQRTTKRKD